MYKAWRVHVLFCIDGCRDEWHECNRLAQLPATEQMEEALDGTV